MSRGHRGRGARSNREGRFERLQVLVDEEEEATRPSPRTTVVADASRSIIATNRSPDIPFDQSINPYRGCEHGCVYCYARPSHAFLGWSPGLDFETKLTAKFDAPDLLRTFLAKRSYQPKVIALGSNTDPYQPIEREHRLTRQILEVLLAHRHPVAIVSRSRLITRDLDLLTELARHRLIHVMVSITTLDPALVRIMEPRAPSPAARLRTVQQLREAGIPTGVLMAPLIPALTDSELESIMEQCHAAGAQTMRYLLVRLPGEVEQLFGEWLEAHFPDRRNKVLSLLRESRAGRVNDRQFGRRMRGQGVWAELLSRRYRVMAKRLGLAAELPPLDHSLFRVPGRAAQLGLF